MELLDSSYIKHSALSIKNDLIILALESDVSIRADQIYQALNTPICKGKERKKLLFFCIYYAYKELGLQKDPTDIGIMLELNKNQCNSAFKKFSINYQVPITIIDPASFIENYLEITKLDVNHHTEDVKKWLYRIINKDPNINKNIQPQRLAAAVIIHYLNSLGIKFEISVFEKKLAIKANSIQKIVKHIIEIDNS